MDTESYLLGIGQGMEQKWELADYHPAPVVLPMTDIIPPRQQRLALDPLFVPQNQRPLYK